MRLTTATSVICSLLSLSAFNASAQSVGAPVPHIFQPNTPASASQVNENFQALANRIAGASGGSSSTSSGTPEPSQLDGTLYYGTGISSKVFAVVQQRNDMGTQTETDYCGSRWVQDYVQAGDEVRVSTRYESNSGNIDPESGQPCFSDQDSDMDIYRITPQGLVYEQYDNVGHDPLTNQFWGRVAISYNPPRLVIPATVELQKRRLDTPTITFDRYDDPATPSSVTHSETWYRLFDLTPISVESVSVPAGSFDNCLKQYQERTDNGRVYKNVYWHCPGVGTVKDYRYYESDSYTIFRKRELISYQ